jgi:purine-nucleoside phosphorylase
MTPPRTRTSTRTRTRAPTVEDAVRMIRQKSDLEPRVGVVLGSGLGGLADEVENQVEISYRRIPGWPASTAVGHAGVLVLGSLDGVPVAVLRGRAHLYEGIGADRAVFGIRVLGRLGLRTLVVTNAAGAVNVTYRPGMLVLISDHINLMGASPLVGRNDDDLGPRFPDLSDAYDPELRRVAHEIAELLGLDLPDGVYVAWLGPQFETPAEIRFMRAVGGDLAGMSTVPEVIAARHMGIRCLGISVVTNMAAGVFPGKVDHEAVLAVGADAQSTLTVLLRALMPALAS